MGANSDRTTPRISRARLIALIGCIATVAALSSWILTTGSRADSAPAEDPRPTIVEEPSPALLEALESPPGLEEAAEKLEREETKLPTPEETAELLESRQLFRDLDSAEAAREAKQQFPEILNEPAYQPLDLTQGERITDYPTPNVAQLDLANDEHSVVESQLPLVTTTPSGKQTPVDLALIESDGVIEPRTPLTPVEIAIQLSEGISLPESGVTLTPVDDEGGTLTGAPGVIEEAVAFYANTQTDTDTVAKPLPAGFETETLLRSPASPQKLYFQIGGNGSPQLTQASDESISVEEQGKPIATISPVTAVDAAGNQVPASVDVNGNQIVLTVEHRSGEYQYPIAVDPTVSEKNWGYFEQGPWYFTTNNPSAFNSPFTAGHPEFPTVYTEVPYSYSQYGAWNYTTQGISRIYSYEPSVWSAYSGDQMTNLVGIIGSSGWEPQQYLGTYVYPQLATTQCPVAGCPSTGGTPGNTAVYEKVAINSGTFTYGLSQNLNVKIAQDTGPSITFDTADKEVEGHLNPLYGSGVWLTSGKEGRFKATATDPGIGIYKRGILSPNYSSWNGKMAYGSATGCIGVQCLESYTIPANVGNLPEGVNTVEAKVENATGAIGTKAAQVKIDNTAPFADVLGLPDNFTISRGSVHKLEFVLGDGEAPTASSGVAAAKSEVQIDGEVVLGKGGAPGCSAGPCQVIRIYDLHSRSESSGIHVIKIFTEDNAGNSSTTEVPFLIKAGPATQMGPGTLDLASGGFSLSSRDVSASDVGNGLSLTRSYDSQGLPAVASPFGPNWQMSLGGWQGVQRLTSGAAVFTDARGRSLLFAPEKGGGYTSPPGYQGWSLSYDSGSNYSSSFGSEGIGNGQFKQPTDVAVDAKGNLWVVDKTNNRIEQFNEKGEFLKATGALGTTGGKFTSPSGLVLDSKGNIWVTDTSDNRVEEFSEAGVFVATFGKDVNKTKVSAGGTEAQRNLCTAASGDVCQAGTAGGANGQFVEPKGIAATAGGNLMVVDAGNNRVQKISPSGEYLAKISSTSEGAEHLKEPAAVTVAPSDGSIWVADAGNNRIVEWSSTFEFIRSIGSEGTGIAQFNHPNGIVTDSEAHVWVSDTGNNRVQKLNMKGEFLGQFGAKGGGPGQLNSPTGIRADAKGSFWVVDTTNNRIQKWIVTTPSFKLTDVQGDVTTFKQPGGEGELYLPSSSVGPSGNIGTSFQFETVEGVTRPTRVLGPVPSGVTCTTFVRGCRALTFAYASSTTATSDEPSGWGSYKGRLGSVELHAWNPETSSMVAVPVIDYSYDVHGRLRATWDPRISPALKTIYGYDAAGHVTAMTPPGQQTWAFKYGTQGGETQSDWLLSVSRTKASTAIGGGEAPQNTVVPTLTNSYPKVGTSYKVWNGTWGNSPGGYGYQWDRCSAAGTACVAIAGATDQAYTPVSADSGHALVAEVTATNAGGSVTAVSAPSAAVGTAPPLVYASQFGKAGSGTGQFSTPNGIAVDSSGFIWVVDSGNNRLEKFTSAGVFSAAYGTAGSGNNQFSNPTDIAINPTSKEIYVTDTGNNRIEQFTSAGAFVKTFGTPGSGAGQLKSPTGLTIDSSGNVWVADTGNHRIEKFSSSGSYLTAMTGSGLLSTPRGVAVSGSTVYVSEATYDVVFKLSTTSGEVVGCICEGETKAGSGNGEFNEPGDIAIDSSGRVYVSDGKNNRFQIFSSAGVFVKAHGTVGVGGGQFTEPTGISVDSGGNAFIADHANRVQKWEPDTKQTSPPTPDPTTAVWTAIYHVPVSGAGAPYDLSASAVSKWAQTATPIEATAIFPPDQVPARSPASYKRATLYYMDNAGNAVNTVAPGGRIATAEYDVEKNLVRSLSPGNRAVAMEAGGESATKAKLLDTQFAYSPNGIDLLAVLGPRHKVKLASGKEVEARLHTQYTYDQGAPEGGPYHLMTTETEGAQVSGEADADVRTKTFSYSGQSNLGWSLRQPTSTTVDPGGLNLVSRTIYDPVTGNVTETRRPGNPEGGDAHSQRTIYYSAKAATPASCGEHAEWADLPCQTSPAAQPGTLGLPDLPTTTTQYNVWQEPVTTTAISGSESRTRTIGYDAAGRPTSVALSASSGAALPAVSIAYSPSLGLPTTESASGVKGFEATTSEYNSLGQLTGYTDAGGVTSSYAYDIDGRPTEVNDGKGTQAAVYDSTTGDLVKLTDSDIGAITATYDAQGHIATEGYPNGMTAAYSYDSTGAPTKVVDTKTTNCAEACVWYSDEATPSIHGQWLKEASTRVTQGYAYDAAGRLTQTQEAPASTGCTTTIYAYDADTNRTSTTTRPPKEGGGCAESGGTTVANSFDAGDRLTDAGVTYDPFGDITELPAADAGGSPLKSTYYVDGSLATQSQNGQALAYRLDPFGRDVEVTASGSSSSVTVSHFSSGSDSPSWTIDEAGNSIRYIGGLDGSLAAIRQGSAEPQLQIANLHGDVVATAPLSETSKSLTWTAEATATGIPRGGKPAKYGWLGATQRPTELESGVVNLGSHTYVPQLGRSLQPTVSLSDSSAYVPGAGDPVNEAAVNGRYTPGVPAWLTQFEANPPNLPPPPPPPAAEEEFEAYEIDPVARGKYGQLHITIDVQNCSEDGCDARFHANGVIAGAGDKSVALHMYIDVWNPAFGGGSVLYHDYGVVHNVRTPSYEIDLFIPYGTWYEFKLYVRVGKHEGTLGLEFTAIKHEIVY